MTSRWAFRRRRLFSASGEVMADWPVGPAVRTDRRRRRPPMFVAPEPALEQDDIDTLGIVPGRPGGRSGKPAPLPRR